MLDPRLTDAAFSELVGTHSPRLLAYCRRFARDADEQEDLLQSIWVIAWSRRRQYRGRGPIDAWLLRIARTICYRHLAQQRRFAAVPATLEAEGSTSIAEARAQEEDRDRLLSAILALPRRRRQAVLLRRLAGLSTRETAKLMRCSCGTVKATLHQAMTDLRSRRLDGG